MHGRDGEDGVMEEFVVVAEVRDGVLPHSGCVIVGGEGEGGRIVVVTKKSSLCVIVVGGGGVGWWGWGKVVKRKLALGENVGIVSIERFLRIVSMF